MISRTAGLSGSSKSPTSRLLFVSAIRFRHKAKHAAPLYRDAPEAEAAERATEPAMEEFMLEVLPAAPSPVRDVACDLIMPTLSTVGQDFSATPQRTRSRLSRRRWRRCFARTCGAWRTGLKRDRTVR
ncbi:hypothetical protein [Rhizobium sp.]|uniref:hypothetical protein n=1 Tax=Rhizobium TaxID=379 RepID=UPI0039827ECC